MLLTFLSNERVQRFLFQAVFALVVLVFVYVLITNIQAELDGLGLEIFPFVSTTGSFPFIDIGPDFLGQRAGFSIDERAFGFDYSANDTYLRAFQTGILNTIQIAIIGIVISTIIGVIVGVSRLSSNWLVSTVATVYVETFRNIPLIVQLIFWYLAVFLKAPIIGDSLDFFGVAFLSNRGLALPEVSGTSGFGIWLIFVAIAIAAAVVVRQLLIRRQDETGKPSYPWWGASGAFLTIAGVSFLITGTPLSVETPEVGRFSYEGGMKITPEFAALLTGLSIYTAAFIAEIVRGSVQAIPKGQTEAAEALGLNGFQRLRLVILPQALVIIIPPLTNQYLNLTKNSSLAVAVAFKDLFDVGRITINQAGQAVPMVALIMFSYLGLSLTISAVMNFLYSRLKWRSLRQ
ncbi:MAG: ABC transporter permease subunit [Chloroflexi bacterium]|nr:ABC transporter permease subunit [Chloroflexota bacterium]